MSSASATISDWGRPTVAIPLNPLIPNAEATLYEIQCETAMVPVIVPDLHPKVDPKERSWVTCLESAVVGYVMDEWQRHAHPSPGQLRVAKVAQAISSLGPWRRAIQVGSLPFSTTLRTPEQWQALWALLPELRERFPDRPFAVRNVFPGQLPDNLPTDAVLLPARVTYHGDFRRRTDPRTANFRRDLNLFRKSGLKVLCDEDFDADRITEAMKLYAVLYREKYSLRGPDYRLELIEVGRARGWMTLFGLVDPDSGRLVAFAGIHEIEGLTSVPMLGHDMSQDKKVMLYRHLSASLAERSLALALEEEASSGAGEFKRIRGYVPQLEHLLIFPALCGLRRWSDRAILALMKKSTRQFTVDSMIASGG